MKRVRNAKVAELAADVAGTVAGVVVADAVGTAAEAVAAGVEVVGVAGVMAGAAAAIANLVLQNLLEIQRACVACASVFIFVARVSHLIFSHSNT